MTRIVWTSVAVNDRAAIMDFIAQDNPMAAIELDDAFEAKAESAALNPALYRPGRVRGTREIVVRPNYVMVYRIEQGGEVLTILRVLHAAQQWPPAKKS